MELEPHVNRLRDQVALAAEGGGEETRALAHRLIAPLDAAIRLTLLDVLTAAAAEITRELAPGSVELRLRGRDPEFVLSARPADRDATDAGALGGGEAWGGESVSASAGIGEGGVSRVNVRMPDQLKRRVEQTADREGLSINAWLVRAAAAAVERGESSMRGERGTPTGGQRYKGWGR
jgi:hypothetical protein